MQYGVDFVYLFTKSVGSLNDVDVRGVYHKSGVFGNGTVCFFIFQFSFKLATISLLIHSQSATRKKVWTALELLMIMIALCNSSLYKALIPVSTVPWKAEHIYKRTHRTPS